uniref:Uncharacterized protein n=1 Tax=Athene cunicularia TaxID=194338 RepID=A0A663N2E7_ATHCN
CLLPPPEQAPVAAVRLPSKRELCKHVAVEPKSAFEETGNTKQVTDTKYGFLDGKGSVTENICKGAAGTDAQRARQRCLRPCTTWCTRPLR